MRTDELDFDLPPELIAQSPSPDRGASRLLHYRRDEKTITHGQFSDVTEQLLQGDLLVLNDARVIPARLLFRKSTGGRVEGLFLSEPNPGRWRVMLRNLGDAATATVLMFDAAPEISATVIERYREGEFLLSVDAAMGALELLERVGRMPLPPYIKREKDRDARDADDRERYQTVYAKTPGAVAAPTAGLHFTPALFERLEKRGIDRAMVTLHVGMGTFKPVTADTLESHLMHTEHYHISEEAAEKLNGAQREKRRIIAVGTTSARVLESHSEGQTWAATTGETSIFIYPPYRWKHTAAIITNFHLPRSTLIALVAAMVGLDEQRRIYREAIEKRYRFFSYGDAMLVE